MAASGVLLIIAHPDDESMFFLPTIRHFKRLGNQLYVLCLSTGNACGLGLVRAQELCYACSLIGIGRDCVQVVDDARLQDGMQMEWPLDAVGAHVEAAVRRWNPQTIVTFDAGGVSGHPNHVAVAGGVARAAAALRAEGFGALELWQLVTHGVLRQWIGVINVLVSLLACKIAGGMKCVVAPGGPAAAWPAMRAHASQFVWFRKLFVLFSSYVYVNTLIAVT